MGEPGPTFPLEQRFVHLGVGAVAEPTEAFDGTSAWFDRYASVRNDEPDSWLVSSYAFDGPWSTWEVHPYGHEVVICTEGRMTLHQDIDGTVTTVTLDPGQALINPPGAWHTADIEGHAKAVFITAGAGTQVRPR